MPSQLEPPNLTSQELLLRRRLFNGLLSRIWQSFGGGLLCHYSFRLRFYGNTLHSEFLLCCPSCLLRGCNTCSSLGAHSSALLRSFDWRSYGRNSFARSFGTTAALWSVSDTFKSSSRLLKVGNLRVDSGKNARDVHSEECNPRSHSAEDQVLSNVMPGACKTQVTRSYRWEVVLKAATT